MKKNRILIVGMGQIGTSIGLALQPHSDRLLRVGHTRIFGSGNHAKKIGALDKVAINLPSAVRKANIIVLSLPMDQVQSTLELIAKDLSDGTVVLDTSPSRAEAANWAEKCMPEHSQYVGFTPVLNPQNLHFAKGGIEESSELLFQDGMFVITSPLNTSNEALKLAGDLATLLRATPMFADSLELDSYFSVMHILPQMLAAGLSNITTESPGWGEIRKLAGRPYAQLTSLIENIDSPEALSLSARLNKENVLRSLDDLIGELSAMREELAEDAHVEFDARITRAGEGRRKWWVERQLSEWLHERGADGDLTIPGGQFGQLFAGVRTPRLPNKED